MKVWLRKEKQQTLMGQSLLLFLRNIIYTLIYAKVETVDISVFSLSWFVLPFA